MDKHHLMRGPQSLRARLLLSLGAAIALVALVQAAVAYRTALAEADAIFDYHMQQTAMSLRGGLPLDPEAQDDESPDRRDTSDDNFDFVVQIWAADGQQLYRSARRLDLPDRAVPGYATVQARDTTYRVYSIQTPRQVIQVAQDMAVRRNMARTLALRTVAPVAWLAPLLLAAAWWVVGSTLMPLQRLRSELAQRRADDLGRVGEAPLPSEIRPLVHELNGLFGRLQQAFDAQQRFVADAAHELRSPLAALKLQVQALARAPDDATRERAMHRLDAGIERASQLVEQLLLLARQQDGAGPPLQLLVLADVLRLALADVAPMAQMQGIDLGLLAPEARPGSATGVGTCTGTGTGAGTGTGTGASPDAHDTRVNGDAEALRVLLRNLLDNAVKYTPTGGRVDVTLQRQGKAWCVQVEDSGPGIEPAEQQRVFDRFYRVPGAAVGSKGQGPGPGQVQVQVQGLGLGLAIVQAIATSHGATLALGRSARLGGLQVVMCLPIAPAARLG